VTFSKIRVIRKTDKTLIIICVVIDPKIFVILSVAKNIVTLRCFILIPNIDLSQIPHGDEALKEVLAKILCDKYRHDVRINDFSKEEIRNWQHSTVFRLYIQLDSSETFTVILKQFNPESNNVDIVILQEALGTILSGKKVAPEYCGEKHGKD